MPVNENDTRVSKRYSNLRKEYETGATLRELAEKYGVDKSNIRIALLRRGTKMRRGGSPFKVEAEQ